MKRVTLRVSELIGRGSSYAWAKVLSVVTAMAVVGLALASDAPTLMKGIYVALSALPLGVGFYNDLCDLLDRRRSRGRPGGQDDQRAGSPTNAAPDDALQFKPAVWNMPHLRNPLFVGRAREIDAVHKQLETGYPLVLHGIGGVGKTQIAVEYAHRYAGDYDLVWWLRADSTAALERDCAELAGALYLVGNGSTSYASLVRLELERRSCWLVIYDNAGAPGALEPIIPRRGGHVVITSRCPDWGHIAHEQPITAWSRCESVSYLKLATGDSAGADILSRILGDLPLALAQAAAHIRATGSTCARYTSRFAKDWNKLLAENSGVRAYPDTVAVTFRLALDAANRIAPGAKELMQLCSFYAPGDLPLDTLFSKPELLSAGPIVAAFRASERATGVRARWARMRAGLPAIAHAGGAIMLMTRIQEGHLDDMVMALRTHGLMSRGYSGWEIHPLVQAVTLDRIPKAERSSWAATAVRLVVHLLPEDMAYASSEWPRSLRLFPHGIVCAMSCICISKEDRLLEPGTLVDLLCRLAGFAKVYALQRPLAHGLATEALRIAQQSFGPSHRHVALSLSTLGITYHDLGDLDKAEECHRSALAISEKTYGSHDPNVARDLNNLGTVLDSKGDGQDAIAMYERAWTIGVQANALHWPIFTAVASNLGSAYAAEGDQTRGVEWHRLSVKTCEDRGDLLGPTMATSLNTLGMALVSAGDLVAAKDCLERCVSIQEEIYGKSHARLVDSVAYYGAILRALGDEDAAREQLARALGISTLAYGGEHPFTQVVRKMLEDPSYSADLRKHRAEKKPSDA